MQLADNVPSSDAALQALRLVFKRTLERLRVGALTEDEALCRFAGAAAAAAADLSSAPVPSEQVAEAVMSMPDEIRARLIAYLFDSASQYCVISTSASEPGRGIPHPKLISAARDVCRHFPRPGTGKPDGSK